MHIEKLRLPLLRPAESLQVDGEDDVVSTLGL
jgi:hypothetical protein